MRMMQFHDKAEQLADAELVARCRLGDDAAWRELVERFSRYVYAIAVQAFRLREHDAEDVFQEVFARVYERLEQLRDDAAVRPWIAQLTRRLCLDRVRQNTRVEVSEDEIGDEADESIAQIDESFGLHQLLATLPEHCQEILDRFFAKDESYRTIGEALDLPPGTIASRISRCLAKLREHYDADEGRKAVASASGKQAT
jgi:RNA polymerase sigma factor (sigma-70 family)